MNKLPQIQSLLCLLEDPDESIYRPASEQLIRRGRDVVPELETAWEQSLDTLLQERIEEIIHRIQYSSTLKMLQEWAATGGKKLEEGAYLVARFQYPDLDYKSLQHTLHKLKQDVWLELNDNMTALEQIRVVNHILFQVHGFHGNSSNFYAPQNSFMNDVLSSKKGNPIALALIYLYLAQELDIPVYGVDLPKNFILAYLDEYAFTDEQNQNILFYINPYNRGTILSQKEINYFIQQQELQQAKSCYQPCGNVAIIKRLLLSLIQAYEKLGYPEKMTSYKNVLQAIKSIT